MRLTKFCKNLCTASRNTCRCNIGFEHYCEIPIEQRENRLKDSLGKFTEGSCLMLLLGPGKKPH